MNEARSCAARGILSIELGGQSARESPRPLDPRREYTCEPCPSSAGDVQVRALGADVGWRLSRLSLCLLVRVRHALVVRLAVWCDDDDDDDDDDTAIATATAIETAATCRSVENVRRDKAKNALLDITIIACLMNFR
jgi:hypothetical protein